MLPATGDRIADRRLVVARRGEAVPNRPGEAVELALHQAVDGERAEVSHDADSPPMGPMTFEPTGTEAPVLSLLAFWFCAAVSVVLAETPMVLPQFALTLVAPPHEQPLAWNGTPQRSEP